jgi:anaphase-promoting complex subunit 6
MRALALDVKNYDAFCALVEGRLLGAAEQWNFVRALEYVAQAGEAEEAKEGHELIRLLYTSRLDKEGAMHAAAASAARRTLLEQYDLSQNADVLLGLAEELFARLRFEDAHVVTSRILSLRIDHEATLPLHIAVLFHLPAQRPALFLLAHHLSDTEPSLPASWYAVGMWYAVAQRWAEARRFFSKAVHLDPRFCAAWIAFAHSFALEGETEQAVTSYSTAARHFPQSHMPKLFIGMEYIAQGNLLLAKLFLEGSHALFEHDPLCFNERGVVAFYEKECVCLRPSPPRQARAAADVALAATSRRSLTFARHWSWRTRRKSQRRRGWPRSSIWAWRIDEPGASSLHCPSLDPPS